MRKVRVTYLYRSLQKGVCSLERATTLFIPSLRPMWMSADRVLLADNDVLNRILYYASQHFEGFVISMRAI
jgi:hypothetical protein